MNEDEPAWRRELRAALERWDPYEVEAPMRMKGGLLDTVLPHIQAAEERGRREAAEKIRARYGRHRPWGVWVEGWRAAADYIDPAKPESS